MKLKKILSLVVTLALVFSMVTISSVHAAENEFAILAALGIDADFSDDTTPITRIELAQIALALTGDLTSAEGEAVYPDIPVKHKYFPLVNTVTNEGLMGALADGSFGPDNLATGMDAGRILLAELGYSAFGKQANWTDAQYNSKVQSLSLLRGVNTSDGLTAREMGKMIVNMLTTKVMEISTITSEGIAFTESNLTYIEFRYGYVLRTGVMQANGKASMTGSAQVSAKQAVIDGVIYKTNGQNFSEYVGYNVKYVLTSPYEDGQLIHAEKYQPSEEVVIEAENIVDYGHYRLTFINDDEEQETINFSSSTRIVINGQNMKTYDARYFTPDNGSITFVDETGDGNYEVVNIETKVYFKVGGASATTLSDQWTLDVIRTDDYEGVYVYNNGIGAELMSFEPGTYAEIAPGAVEYTTINGNEIMKPDYGNSEIMTINLLQTTSVTGKITGRKANALVVDGVSYDLNLYFADLIACDLATSAPLGATVTAVVNEKGQIIDITDIVTDYVSVSDSLTYGYMISMNSISGMSKGAYIRMVDFYNLEEVVLKTAEDCKINGKEFDYNKVTSVDPTKTSSSVYWPTGEFKHQLIKYALNADGEISAIYLYKDYSNQYLMTGYIGFSDTLKNPDYDSSYTGYSNNDFTLDRAGVGMKADNTYLEDLYSVKVNHTVQLKIPPNPRDLTLWTVDLSPKTSSGEADTMFVPFYNSTNRNDFEVYDVNSDYSIGVLIKRAAGGTGLGLGDGFTDQGRSIIVTEVEDIYDDIKEEERRQITGYQATPQGVRKVTYVAARNDLPSSIHPIDKVAGGTYPGCLWTDIEVGDIIRVALNSAGEVGGFGIFVKKEYYTDLSNPPYGEITQKSASHANYGRYTMGYVTAVYGEVEGAMMNVQGPGGDFGGLYKIGQPKVRAGGNQQPGAAMIWDLSSKTGTMATCADLKVGDICIVNKGGGAILEIFAFRE